MGKKGRRVKKKKKKREREGEKKPTQRFFCCSSLYTSEREDFVPYDIRAAPASPGASRCHPQCPAAKGQSSGQGTGSQTPTGASGIRPAMNPNGRSCDKQVLTPQEQRTLC